MHPNTFFQKLVKSRVYMACKLNLLTVKGKEDFELKPVKTRLKTDIVMHPARYEKLGKSFPRISMM